MNRFSRVLFSISLLLCSTMAVAESYKEQATPIEVIVPNFKGGFEFSVAGLYFKPTSSNLQYVSTSNENGFALVPLTTGGNLSEENINPTYGGGFLINLGYIFPNTANDARISWTHFNHSSTDNASFESSLPLPPGVTAPAGLLSLLTRFGEIYLLDGAASAEGRVSDEFDAIDLDVGQYINIGHRLQTRIFVGLRYAQLENTVTAEYQGSQFGLTFTHIGLPFSESDKSESTFKGIGPLLGVNAEYLIAYGFGINGSIDGALLAGRLSLDQDAHFTQIFTAFGESFDYDDLNLIVPAFDARLGINYNYTVHNGALLQLELGYQVTQYFNVIEESEFIIDNEIETSNFSLNGPYFSINVKL